MVERSPDGSELRRLFSSGSSDGDIFAGLRALVHGAGFTASAAGDDSSAPLGGNGGPREDDDALLFASPEESQYDDFGSQLAAAIRLSLAA